MKKKRKTERKTNDGKNLIIDRQIGKIGEEEFKKRAKELLDGNSDNNDSDMGIDNDFDFLDSFVSIEKEKLSDDKVEEDTLYRILEYNTIKRKIVTDMDTSIKNAKRFGKILDETEIYDMLKKLQIENIASVSDIEIINTAYGYTRKYQAPDEMRTDRKEPLVLRAFHDVNKHIVPNFYNIRTKTEGIIIDINKRALYKYLKETYSKTKQFLFKDLNDDESKIFMVDSNMYREKLLPSEKAFAYKLKNDVLKRKSGRKKSQVDHKTPRKRSIDIISEDCGDSPKQVQRYISLTKLIPEMLQKLDDEIISFCPAYGTHRDFILHII